MTTNNLDRSYDHQVELFAQRILAGEEMLGHHFVNHYHRRRGERVVIGKEASFL